MNGKILVLCILSVVVGIAFFVMGFYFLGGKFLRLLNESAVVKSEEMFKKNEKRAKSCGYVSMGLGGITFVWAILMFMFPSIASMLGLIYMVVLGAGLGVLLVAFK